MIDFEYLFWSDQAHCSSKTQDSVPGNLNPCCGEYVMGLY